MTPISEILTDWIRGALRKTLGDVENDYAQVAVVATANPEFGDYQCNAAMSLAKAQRKSPRDIAQAIVSLPLPECLEKAEVAGPGFVNMTLKSSWLSGYLHEMSQLETLGVPRVGEGKKVVIDYSAPNVAKPMHIGHIRSTGIGNALDRLYRMLGYAVISDNHIGDWGTQFGIIIRGYRNYLDEEAFASNPVDELERLYVKSNDMARKDEAWMNACRAELVKLQAGDKENVALWKRFVSLSMGEFEKIYDRLGVSFDYTRGESYYNDRLRSTVDLLVERGLATESEGATVVFLEEEKLPVCIVQKSDGGFNYATTDIATVMSRIEEFSPDRVIYVTDERQQLHFKQFFAITRRLGYDTQLEHVWFGLMRMEEGTFSTRDGNVIKLEALLDEAERRALEVVRGSSPEMPEDQQKAVARAVSIGAVKYADLSQSPQTVVTFTWEKALALDGNSGPYLQYAYARIASVRDKYKEKFPGKECDEYPLVFTEPVERILATKLILFPGVVERAAHGYKPSVVADYLFDLAQTYSTFYQNVPFLKAEEGIRESRVRLCGLVARVLQKGLALLGIETLERI